MSYYKSAKNMYEDDYSQYTDIYTKEGGNIYNLFYPSYVRLSNLTQIADELTKKINMQDALANGYSDFVEKRADELGITRKQATYAEINVTFTGTPNEMIKKGFVVGTLDNRLYYTTTDLIIGVDGTVNGIVKAELSGSKYNVQEHEITYIPVPVKYITSVDNEEAYNDAYDKESDESLAERYYIKARHTHTSGNKYHYESWALEVDGVGYAHCIPAEESGKGGVVKVIIASSNKRKASDELIQKTYDHINEERPVLSGTLEVVTVTEIMIDIVGNVEIDTTTTLNNIQNIFQEKLEEYFDNYVYENKKISIAKVQAILMNIDGVVDCSDIKINGNTSNIVLDEEEIAVLNSVSLGVI